MLVKLNGVWVNPSNVEGISIDGDGCMRVYTETNFYTCPTKENTLDECAAIINSGANTYGGEYEKEN